MASTTSTTTDDQPVRGLPTGHVIAYGHAFRAPDFGSYTAGDGGVVSSAADMARWLVVNTHGGVAPDGTRVVSTSGLEQLHTPSAPRTGYALGWATRGPREAPTRLEHSGSLLTYTAELGIWPGTGYGVVLMFNSGSPMMLDQTAIAHGVFDIVEGTSPPAHGPRAAGTIDRVLAALTLILVAFGVAASPGEPLGRATSPGLDWQDCARAGSVRAGAGLRGRLHPGRRDFGGPGRHLEGGRLHLARLGDSRRRAAGSGRFHAARPVVAVAPRPPGRPSW